MRSKSFKKMLAGTLALTMVLGASVTALAQTGDPTGSGSTTSDGTFEGHVDKDVIAVKLPTVAADSDTFAFTMDPEGLIVATANEKYPDATFEGDTGVYFLSDTNTYTADSAKLKVTNVGTVDVDVTLTAYATVDTGITVATDAEFDGSAAEVYLGLVVDGTVSGNGVNEVVVGADSSHAGTVVAGLKGRDANYEITVSGNDYVFAQKDGVADTAWNSFEFGLTGACDKNADWGNVATTNTSVTVTWAYAKATNDTNMLDENATNSVAPSVTVASVNMAAGTAAEIPVSLGSGDDAAESVSSVTMMIGGNAIDLLASNKVSYADNKISVAAGTVDWLIGEGADVELTVTFDNDTSDIVTLKVPTT